MSSRSEFREFSEVFIILILSPELRVSFDDNGFSIGSLLVFYCFCYMKYGPSKRKFSQWNFPRGISWNRVFPGRISLERWKCDESSAVPMKYERDRGEKVFWYHNREKIRLWNPFWSHKKLKEARTEALRTKKIVSPSLHLFIQITARGAGLSRFASQNYFLQYCWGESAPLRLYIEYLVFIFGCSVLSQVFQ